jgi:hypothetical protein
MDHFLWARNPLKKTAPTGLQGYIIDTVKGCWFEVHVFQQARKPDLHKISLIAGTGDKQQDYHSADRASRWYNSILIARKIKEVDINVELIQYPSVEASASTALETAANTDKVLLHKILMEYWDFMNKDCTAARNEYTEQEQIDLIQRFLSGNSADDSEASTALEASASTSVDDDNNTRPTSKQGIVISLVK